MKRYGRFLVGLLFVAMLFSACAPKDINTKISTMSVQADTSFDAQTLEELESQAKYIVQGKFQDDATEDLQSEAGIVLYGATVSSFEITKVYKGDFEVGDVIKVAEQYYVCLLYTSLQRTEHVVPFCHQDTGWVKALRLDDPAGIGKVFVCVGTLVFQIDAAGRNAMLFQAAADGLGFGYPFPVALPPAGDRHGIRVGMQVFRCGVNARLQRRAAHLAA